MVNSPQQGTLFDGFSVSLYDGKFVGGFDLDENVSYDDVVVFVVSARVDGASFKANKNGDIKRTNHFQVTSVNALERGMGEKILDTIGASVNGVNSGQMPLPVTSTLSTGRIDENEEPEDFHFDDDDDEMVTVQAGQPISDPVLQKFLQD